MIGTLDIKVLEELPQTGDRHDYLIQISGPGENVYKTQASITRTLASVWQLTTDPQRRRCIESLVESIVKVIGTASPPPEDGFWFDTYNTQLTPEETIRQTPNNPNAFFRGRTVRDEMALYLRGTDTMKLLEEVQEAYFKVEGERFFDNLDHAFTRSQAVEDMNTPPNDRANFLYRICILSVILDRLNFRQYDDENRSLIGFSNWLRDKYGEEFADEVTEPLFMLKRLRRQYPLHEHYVEMEGSLITRQDLAEAELYFELNNTDFAHDWHKVSKKFHDSFDKLFARMSGDNVT